MRCKLKLNICSLLVLVTAAFTAPVSLCAGPRSRVSANLDYAVRTRLTGHVHPNATAENDIGALDGAEVLSAVTVALKPSAEQETQLEQLISEQQDPNSP